MLRRQQLRATTMSNRNRNRLWPSSMSVYTKRDEIRLRVSRVFVCSPTLLLFLLYFSPSTPVHGQIIIIPKSQVVEPFKNNPKWEDFKTAQFDRLKVLGTLVANVWTLIDTLGESQSKDIPVQQIFVKHHVPAFVNFFKESEARLVDENPYAILDPAVGIHTIESLYKLSSLPSSNLNQLRIKWMEIDAMALTVHLYFNETTHKIISGEPNVQEHVFNSRTETFPTALLDLDKEEGSEVKGETKNMTIAEISKTVDKEMTSLGSDSHLIRGLVKLLSSMTQRNVDNRETLNYYCYGNNDFGVFQDIYDILTDAALYLVMMDMKKLILDVYLFTFAKIFDPPAVVDTVEQRLAFFNEMVDRVRRKIDFDYLEGSDFTELPHPPIFKCDRTPEEWGIPTQWGRNLTTGISPAASATYPYDPQAGPEKEDGNVGYIDNRTPMLEYVEFDKAFHGYLESEMVLNPMGQCKGTCRDYKQPTKTCIDKDIDCPALRQSHCDPSTPNCMKTNQCPEYAHKCERSSAKVTMCPEKNGTQYYNFMEYNDGRAMGIRDNETREPCEEQTRVARERWTMEDGIILNNPQYCELCLCTCMTGQEPEHQHYVNLEPAVVDAAAGYVVSAVQFVQEERVLSLAVEQGKPLLGGDIDASTTQWVEIIHPDKTDPTKAAPLGMKGFLRMNFDLAVGEADQVVTGVRFQLAEHQTLVLETQVTPISWPPSDPSAITLHVDDSTWIRAQDLPDHSPRAPLKFYKPDSPARQEGPSMPDVVYNSFVEFTTTDYEGDLAQSTIPFFDTQPVSFYETKRWLQGVGVFHKGKPKSGGFIAPLVVPSKGKKSSI